MTQYHHQRGFYRAQVLSRKIRLKSKKTSVKTGAYRTEDWRNSRLYIVLGDKMGVRRVRVSQQRGVVPEASERPLGARHRPKGRVWGSSCIPAAGTVDKVEICEHGAGRRAARGRRPFVSQRRWLSFRGIR